MVIRLTAEGERVGERGRGPGRAAGSAAAASEGAEGAPGPGEGWHADYLGEEWRAGGGSVDGGD